MLLNPSMAKKEKKSPSRRPLTAEERAEGQRLKAAIKRAGTTQEKLAFEMGWKGQSAVGQYVNNVPMSDAVIIRMAVKLGIPPTDIRPGIWNSLPARPLDDYDTDTITFADEYDALSPEDRQILRKTLELLKRRPA